jgi:hypothetical protein
MTPVDTPTLIIVDDDALVRASIQRGLKSVGPDPRPSQRPRSFCAGSIQMVPVASFWTCNFPNFPAGIFSDTTSTRMQPERDQKSDGVWSASK